MPQGVMKDGRLCDSYPQARYKVWIALFPGWESGSIHKVLCTACKRQEVTVTQDVYFCIQEGKKVSLNSDSVFRAKEAEDQRHSAFLKDALIHHVVIVLFFFA